MAKTTKLIGYGISFDMKLVGGAKTADDFRRVGKTLEKSINKASRQTKDFELAQEQLNQALQKGGITQKQYEQQLTSLKFKEIKRIERLEKERRAVQGLDKQESLLAKKRQQRARMAGMAASGVSGIGMGGRAAGAARFLGGAAGMGAGAAMLGGGFIAASTIKESISAFAKLESQVTAMKSLFGEDIAAKLNTEFRALAKTTILTNSQLIENAKTWASYGLTTENLTDRLKRLGTVAGGNSERFRALTVAFAQVNAQGKLMGQEKNQLINAGMSLQAVADAAGISMTEFADAMKNGEITADHLNQALINITNEGGMFAGFLEKQADTILGKMTILSASWEEFLVALGESEKGPASAILDKMISAAEALKDAADFFGGKGVSPRAGQAQFLRGTGGTKQAAEGRPEAFLLAKAGGDALRDEGEGSLEERRAGISFIQKARGISFKEAAKIYDQRMANLKANLEANGKLFEETLNKEKDLRKKQTAADKKKIADFEALLGTEMSDQEIADQFSATSAKLQTEQQKQAFQSQFGMFAPDKADGVNLMEQMGAEEDARKREEKDLLAVKLKNEIEFQKTRQELLKEAHAEEREILMQREKEVSEQLKKDRQLANVPLAPSFESGSVEEFQFLRRQSQESETASAISRAERKAAAQREKISAERKAGERETQLELRKTADAIERLTKQFQDTR